MAESAEQTALQRRATWVGLRTLRQRPKLVGETRSGDPIFEVRSVRLILRDEAGHFSRLTQCSKCGREVPGAPVMSSADLDRPAHSVICKDCVRASVAARPLQPERRATKPERAEAPDPQAADDPEPAEAVADQRLAALERQLQAAMARLSELADPGRDNPAGVRMQEALRQGLAEIRAEVRTSSGDPGAWKELQALGELVEAQQGRLVSLSAVLDETRAEVQRLEADVGTLRADIEGPLGVPVRDGVGMLVQAIQELARARDDIQATVDRLVPGTGDAGGRVETLASAVRGLELRMQDVMDRLQAGLDAPAANGRLTAEAGEPALDRDAPRELLDGLERQLQEAESRLARLTAGPDSGVGPTANG